MFQCESLDGKRPYLSPADLIYAQPVALKPVGRPIATIPVRGPPRPYGQPKPVPYPQRPPHSFGPPNSFSSQNAFGSQASFGSQNSFGSQSSFGSQNTLGPLNSFGPQNALGPQNSFGPPSSLGPRPIPSLPPRRGYTPQFKPPSTYVSQQNSFTSAASSFGSKPLGPIFHPEPIENDQPYKFEGAIGQGSKPYGVVTPQGGLQQHIHHHFHHGEENGPVKIPLSGPISTSQISAAALASTNVLGVNSGLPLNSFSPSSPYGNGLGTYANNVKPVSENYSPQTFESIDYNGNKYGSNSNSFGATVGQYGNTSPFYKKELNLNPQYNLNSVQSQYGQSSYADKFQSFQAGQANFDCVCVPFDQCPAQNVIGRKDDLYLPLDPRNLKTDILAEDTNLNATTEEVKNLTDGEVKKVSKRDVGADGGNSTEKANVEAVSIVFIFKY